ncbi:MAG TPA: hypothetical protein VFG15_02590 [Amycolatopsis sp.]|nr:hypothetical protein [Amycolatopsis sp.]
MGVRCGTVGRFAVVVVRRVVVRGVSGVGWAVVVTGVSGRDDVDVFRGPVATVFGTFGVVAGTT